jgi:hypothetical protein
MYTDFTDFEMFFTACLAALFFTDVGDDGDIPADAMLAEETKEYLRADCLSFWRRFGCYALNEGKGAKDAGHDFWFTRNGHGAGFWDGDWDEPYGHILNEGAKLYGEFQTYLGDDGLIYV